MSCFPRIFHHRQKSSFNPAEDDNTDTLLDNSQNSVQIGRYLRREETPIFTSKSSDNLKQQLQFKQNSPQQQNDNFQHNNNKHAYSNNNNYNANTNVNNISNNNSSKKFISNKQQQSNNNSNNNNHVNHNNSFNNKSNNNQNSHQNTHHSKFKPVKERRPTALPTEAPHIEDDDVSDDDDDVDVVDVAQQNGLAGKIAASDAIATNGSNTPTTPTLQKVKFFIGQNEDNNAAATEVSTKSNNLQQKKLQRAHEENKENDQIVASEASVERQSTTPTATRPKFTTQTSIDSNYKTTFGSLPKHSKGKFPSNSSEKHRKSKYDAPDAAAALNIPTPPPLPPQPLTTASSSASLISQKTSKASKTKRSSKSNTSTASSQRNFNENDQTPSPKDSDDSFSPNLHRVEGGLIFTRINLPVQKDVEIEYIEKDEATRNLIRTAIEKNDFLNNYMDKERKEMVIDAMAPASYEQNSFIINENEEGSEIFVSEEGYFDVIKAGKVIGTLGSATVFGELAILYNAKRFASIKAVTHARVWKIDREKFRNIMVISGSRERLENLNFLRSAPFLQELGEDLLDRVVDLLQRKFYETNTCIVREGEVGNEFFIIRGGTVTIKKKNEYDVERVVDRRKRGEYFGEQALLNADRRQASVYADAPGTECLKLNREAFISYMGTIPQLREKPVEREIEERISNRKSEFNNEYANVELAELKKIATLGAGAFGRVDLVAYQDKTFALKIIKKIDIIKQDQVDHVYSEKHVMMKCSSSPFIIELYKTYRNDKFVYFLMEACMGGDVWTVMSQRRFFDEKTARFLAGCVVEAFDFLHSHHIIYRDLKPENLMLTTDGYCKLVDFGFAKHVAPNQKTNTFAGTPEYVAPEIILDRGHDRSVDYWALGILIFELLVGKTPFRGQNQIKIYQQILGGIDVIQMPSKIPKAAQGLIKHLCKQLPAERLGYQRKGILDIKKHSWFDNLDWNKLKTKQLSSPIKRPISSNTDLQYFVPCGTEHDHDPPDETSGWDIDF